MLLCMILFHIYEYNTLGSKKICLMFLSCEIDLFNNALSIQVTYIIHLQINRKPKNEPGAFLNPGRAG
jgi:NADH:ubiquinone oxidoreductase subunit K